MEISVHLTQHPCSAVTTIYICTCTVHVSKCYMYIICMACNSMYMCMYTCLPVLSIVLSQLSNVHIAVLWHLGKVWERGIWVR